MSQYEIRSQIIKDAAAAMGWSVRWSRQRTRLYFRVDIKDWHPGTGGFVTVTNWVREWYSDALMTSWSGRGGTYFIGDIWEMLKNK